MFFCFQTPLMLLLRLLISLIYLTHRTTELGNNATMNNDIRFDIFFDVVC